MGNSVRRCCRRSRAPKTVCVVVAGLDGAGKSRTASLLAGEPNASDPPTVGFRPVRLRFRGVPVQLHDVGGGAHFRSAWRHYFADAHGLVFVVDSSDRSRVAEGAAALEDTLAHPFIAGKPVLILASKQDIEGAMDDIDIVDKLNIEPIVNRYRCPTRVESYTANVRSGKSNKFQLDPGLKKGYEWLLNYIIYHYDDLQLRVQTDIAKEVEKRQSKDQNETSFSVEQIPAAFENPNYRIDSLSKDVQSEEGIIIVQEAPGYGVTSESIKTTATDVKLSPLFGNKNEQCSKVEPVIELEARTQMRKLSPIVRKKAFLPEDDAVLNPDNFENNPLPNSKKSTPPRSANEIFAQQLREFKSQENISETHERAATAETDVNKVNQPEILDIKNSPKTLSTEPFKSESANRRILPPIKLENHKTSSMNVEINQHSATERAILHQNSVDTVERPKSASESVRMQLEMANGIHNRKLFNFKGIGKTHTSAEENTSLYAFDPDTHDRTGNNKNSAVTVTEAVNS